MTVFSLYTRNSLSEIYCLATQHVPKCFFIVHRVLKVWLSGNWLRSNLEMKHIDCESKLTNHLLTLILPSPKRAHHSHFLGSLHSTFTLFPIVFFVPPFPPYNLIFSHRKIQSFFFSLQGPVQPSFPWCSSAEPPERGEWVHVHCLDFFSAALLSV